MHKHKWDKVMVEDLTPLTILGDKSISLYQRKKAHFSSSGTPLKEAWPPCVSWHFDPWLSLYGAGTPWQEGRGVGLEMAAARTRGMSLQQDWAQRGSRCSRVRQGWGAPMASQSQL